MYTWEIYKWENGGKTEDLTQYLVMPIFYDDRLNEELDTASITLDCVPITVNEGVAFPPKTKFRLICTYFNEEKNIEESENYDMVVDHDDVEYYEGEPNICCHRISLIEASVIAQGMHVDNIALTHEIQDVTLDYKTTIEESKFNEKIQNPYTNVKRPKDTWNVKTHWGCCWLANEDYGIGTATATITNEYAYMWGDGYEDSSYAYEPNKDLKKAYNFESFGGKKIIYNIPKAYCYGFIMGYKYSGGRIYYTNTEKFVKLFELPTETTIRLEKYKHSALAWEKISEEKYRHNPDYSDSELNISDEGEYATGRLIQKVECDDGSIGIALRRYEGNIEEGECDATQFQDNNDWFNRIILERIWLIRQKAASSQDTTVWSHQGVLTKNNITDKSYDSIEITFPCAKRSDEQYRFTISTRVVTEQELCVKLTQKKTIECKGGATWNITFGAPTITTVSSDEMNFQSEIYLFSQYVTNSIEFIKKYEVKYNANDFLRKSILACDTHYAKIENLDKYDDSDELNIDNCSIECGYVIEPANKYSLSETLKAITLQETTCENKNLWEVLVQIGYYIHAIPYLEFCEDKDKFLLNYRRLGAKTKSVDNSCKITVYNSRNLSEYFSQYDAYVSNIFSPQNIIEEWLVPKTSDSSYLISNDTCELHTSSPILELIELKIKRRTETEYKDITNFVFERSVYNCLTNLNPVEVSPAKGNSIYYEYGSNKIVGFSYVAPSVSQGDKYTAIQYILQKIYDDTWEEIVGYTLNDFLFKITYRTQDAVRISQFRPDIFKYMKNSSLEKYPHHEQYYGQQDKLVDSEKVSRNMYGQLIESGNGIYQRQEYATKLSEAKIGGQLIEIKGVPFYVTECENEYYPNSVYQKVTYSKDFNQLSQIVTIPSEPRFYEIASKSIISREIRLFDFFRLSSMCIGKEHRSPRYLKGADSWYNYLASMIFTTAQLPNFAYLKYAGGTFPSSRYIITSDNNGFVSITDASNCECIVPIQKYPLFGGICFEWNMADHFCVGDFVDTNVHFDNSDGNAYFGMQSYRYVDIYGRAKYFKFRLFNKSDMTYEEAQALPGIVRIESDKEGKGVIKKLDTENMSEYIAGIDSVDTLTKKVNDDSTYIVLNKDNREALSFNYQISLVCDDEFVIFPNLFADKHFEKNISKLSCCALNVEVGRFDEQKDIKISSGQKVADFSYEYGKDDLGNLEIKIENTNNIHNDAIKRIKSIIFYAESDTGHVPYIAKNYKVMDWERIESSANEAQSLIDTWYIYPIYND